MIYSSIRKRSTNSRPGAFCCVLLAIWASGSPAQAQSSGQPVFKSAADACQALYQAVQKDDSQAITKILGGPSQLASPHDDARDNADRERFVQEFREMHRLHKEDDGLVTIYVGARNWPFPIPLTVQGGAWYFDSDAGQQEVLFRRIGENELAALATCREFVAAEKRYRPNADASTPVDSSPVSLVARAGGRTTPGEEPVLLDGYYFRLLAKRASDPTRPSSFTLIAYPAEYRSSGVMTFVVTEKEEVYEKDLGPNTLAIARRMTKLPKDATWRTVMQ